MTVKDKHVIFSFVLFVFGFLIASSYQHTKGSIHDSENAELAWERTFYYRQQLIQFEDDNNQLQQEIDQVKLDIIRLENQFAKQEETIGTSALNKMMLQGLTGELPVEGAGVFVSLSDRDFGALEDNADQYIVHDGHVQLVINELYSAGAEAVAVNGQRIFHDSHIVCIGPVIAIDGKQYSAPFVIEAIGHSDTLKESLELSNGVIDILINDQIEVEIGKQEIIEMDARIG
ncbi:DUF881 domain-containing protein [Amphibacillus cookii]|uniref:DUF881 domain-containing protein n=1 Tax=Amphibacillus cookii TaxID=767787 RepID=UPI00195DF93C|nr:DUF881 domain-containing protein [Amphibacillus cookii]MBM7540481.1 uncharacterized protein YlxW (UPF0749 family) [Amphibacillus cookii]